MKLIPWWHHKKNKTLCSFGTQRFVFFYFSTPKHIMFRERYEISQDLRNIDLADIGDTDQIGKDARSRNTCTCTITLDLHRILLVALGCE